MKIKNTATPLGCVLVSLGMYQHKRAGDLDSARQEMRDVLAAEVVPHYRAVAQGQLNLLDDAP
ncbi:DUF2379 family protein [Myxococcus vastator]|uniref:DUF2379 family protein n=1 Tax=Myxococcus vastator TaxID=2709664 RepID=UPI003531C4D7